MDPEYPADGVRVKLSVKVVVPTDDCTEVHMTANLIFFSLRNKVEKDESIGDIKVPPPHRMINYKRGKIKTVLTAWLSTGNVF